MLPMNKYTGFWKNPMDNSYFYTVPQKTKLNE